jgi:hypothetical protein
LQDGHLIDVQPVLQILPLRIGRLQFALQSIFPLLQLEISVSQQSLRGACAAMRKLIRCAQEDGDMLLSSRTMHPKQAALVLADQPNCLKPSLLLASSLQGLLRLPQLPPDFDYPVSEAFRSVDQVLDARRDDVQPLSQEIAVLRRKLYFAIVKKLIEQVGNPTIVRGVLVTDHPTRLVRIVDGIGAEALREGGKPRRIVAPGKVIEPNLVEPLRQRIILDAELGEGEHLLLLALETVEARHAVVRRGRVFSCNTSEAIVAVIREALHDRALIVRHHAHRAQTIGLKIRACRRPTADLFHHFLADEPIVHPIARHDQRMQ